MKCQNCETDCTMNHFMCDKEAEGVWCPECFEQHPCGKGDHGEGCPTQVFQDTNDEKEVGE
jgi:hypothetical protein